MSTAINHSIFSSLTEDEENNGFNEKTTKYSNFFREGKSGGWKKYTNSDVFLVMYFKKLRINWVVL